RQEREFDNAAGIYDNILSENEPSADILWYRTLCEYGIEYVPDPVSDKYFPTLHRINDESIFNCSFFKQAIELSEGEEQKTLLKEAKYIDEIQTKYLNIAANEDPYDVFICYKETDLQTGEKTEDVELAEELYNELKGLGYKVFFARETLKEKLSIDYEPYIFAALKSAKAMAVIGTRAEYFTSVWVKNEWGRFLKLMEKNPEKQMFFACDDPEQLPRAFAGKQAQLLGKANAIKNLAINIDKFLQESKSGIYTNNETAVISKEQQQFNRILGEKTAKFMDDLAEMQFGKRKNEIIDKILDANKEAARRNHSYSSYFNIGAIWLLLSNAISLIAFYVTIKATGSRPGSSQYEVQNYAITLTFSLFFVMVGYWILLSSNRWLLSAGSTVLAAALVIMIINIDSFTAINIILMIINPLLILYIGLAGKGNRYLSANSEAVSEARDQIKMLGELEELAHKEFNGYAKMILSEYKRNYKASDDVQVKEYHYDNVKPLITEDLDEKIKKYTSLTDSNDSQAYDNRRSRITCTIIFAAIAAGVSFLQFLITASPNATSEIANLLNAL
ncbi:MAG: TIR domain-containing protein, partial [Lachnospiraceae bacterium]|nr:TIR domain-containing protein [Lachnospiraceae bacterium]